MIVHAQRVYACVIIIPCGGGPTRLERDKARAVHVPHRKRKRAFYYIIIYYSTDNSTYVL